MTKEYFMRAVKAEMSFEELKDAYDKVYKKKNTNSKFYYPEIYIDVLMKRINGEIDDEYLKTWLIIVCNLLTDEKYYDLSDYFDGWAFSDTFPEIECKEGISFVKDFDLKFRHENYVKYHRRKKMKVVYLRFETCDNLSDDLIYKCYIVDHENKAYDIRIVDTSMLDYDLSKNYCRIRDEEYYAERLKEEFSDDLDVMPDYTLPETQFCEAEYELQDLFFTKGYRRDKTLEL